MQFASGGVLRLHPPVPAEARSQPELSKLNCVLFDLRGANIRFARRKKCGETESCMTHTAAHMTRYEAYANHRLMPAKIGEPRCVDSLLLHDEDQAAFCERKDVEKGILAHAELERISLLSGVLPVKMVSLMQPPVANAQPGGVAPATGPGSDPNPAAGTVIGFRD